MGKMGRNTPPLIRMALLFICMAAVSGLFTNPSSTPDSSRIWRHIAGVSPAQAADTPTRINESAPIPLLNDWPEIDEKPSESATAATTHKKISERSLLPSSRKTQLLESIDRFSAKAAASGVPPAPAVLTSLSTAAPHVAVSAVPAPTAVSENGIVDDDGADPDHDPEEATSVEVDPSMDDDDDFNEETPVYTDEELHDPATEQSPAPSSQPAPEKKKRGYIIRPDGDDLVVYDEKGNEIFRKTRNKPATRSPLTQVEDAGKKLADQLGSPAQTSPIPPVPGQAGLVFHTVKKGENPSLIARKYAGVTAEKIMEANGIKDPSSIQIGTNLWIPGQIEGVCHIVQEGETLSDLLKIYEISDLYLVCDVNGLSRSTNEVPAGTQLVIPGAKPKPQSQVVKNRPHAITIDPSVFRGSAGWALPVDGKIQVSSPYGLRIDPFSSLRSKSKVAAGGGKDGVKRSFHHGIDLSMPVGTPVKAVRHGEVIKVSQSRWGHGRMVQVLHEDGWSTVYSHNSKILVSVGDKVKQGDIISLSGNTGRSTGPHLHFEVRRPDQKSVDPRPFLQGLD